MRTTAAALAVGLIVAGCSGTDREVGAAPPTSTVPAPSGAAPSPSADGAGSVDGGAARPVDVGATLADGLDVPWGLAFLPTGPALLAERNTGRILRLRPGADQPEPVGTVPGVRARGEGGLLGLAVAPSAPSAVFAYFTSSEGDNRVVRIPLDPDGDLAGDPVPVLTGIPAASTHNGGRVVVGPDGKLWIGTGDAGDPARSQDRSNLGGKVLRVELDGSVPDDNPFVGSPVWSLGHRNVQGIAFDSSGQPWATEFGQNTWDELNRLQRGGNFGWPLVEGRERRAGLLEPVVQWRTTEASPSGLAILDDVAYVASLRGRRLWQVPLRGTSAATPVSRLEGGLGRLRTVEVAPDGPLVPGGGLVLTTSNTDGRGDPAADDDRLVVVEVG